MIPTYQIWIAFIVGLAWIFIYGFIEMSYFKLNLRLWFATIWACLVSFYILYVTFT